MLEMHTPEHPLPWSTIVQQWKKAGTALATALSTYEDICSLLSDRSQAANGTVGNLVSQIDSVLGPGALHSVLAGQLARSQAILARTRNRLASPISQIPGEILSEIFLYTVASYSPGTPVYIEDSVWTHYYRLHALLGVCSFWRTVGIKTPKLWSLVPAIRGAHFSVSSRAASISLSRSGTLPLHLAFMIPHLVPNDLVRALREYTSRIKTINITSEGPYTIQGIMNPLLESNIADSLSELSLSTSGFDDIERLGNDPYYMFLPDSPQINLVLDLMKSLTRLRLCGSTLDWSSIDFSSRLVELRLHTVIVGPDSCLHDLMWAVSTAVKLQDLTLINVTSFPEPELEAVPAVVLPDLQSLVIEDLYFNTLSFILQSITSRSHKLTLFLTGKTLLEVNSPLDPEPNQVDVIHLHTILSLVTVNTLLLSNDQPWWTSLYEIRYILLSTPFLQTFKLDLWTIDSHFCRALGDPEPMIEVDQSTTTDIFRAIPEWHFMNAKIADEAGFQNLVIGHSIRTMFLDASLNYGEDELESWRHLTGGESIMKWLEGRIPEFSARLGEERYSPPEFRSAIWQLW